MHYRPLWAIVDQREGQLISFGMDWGGGIEASLGGPWTAKAEYLYYDLSDRTVSGLAGGACPPI